MKKAGIGDIFGNGKPQADPRMTTTKEEAKSITTTTNPKTKGIGGRKKKLQKDKKESQIVVYFTEKELDEIKKTADKMGLSLSSFARMKILS